MGLEDFAKHVEKVKDFTKKYSTYSSDKKIAIGRGSKKPVVCFIGEALGKTENQLGKVFCGVSGKLLNEQINHIGLLKKDYVITNVLPFMPTDSDGKIRKPSNKEILDFSKLLKERLDILKPKAIVLLGKSAAEAFGFSVGLKEAGTFLANNFYFVPHPAYLLRNGLKGFNYYRELKEFLKPKNYLKEITVPKQRARNLSTKYMISQELGIFKEIANQMEINFKDIDTKELFLWNGKRFFVHIQKLTQGKEAK